jgi:hypothetical protein
MAPEVGFEPTTNRLTADRSTTELLRIKIPLLNYIKTEYHLHPNPWPVLEQI